jgi:hypothetical protein
MSEYTYNTDHGHFEIRAKKVPLALKELKKYIKKNCIDLNGAYSPFESTMLAVGLGVDFDKKGNVVDIYLDQSHFGDCEEAVLTKVIAPFVTSGSFVVFYGGGSGGCWAVSWNRKKGKVVGTICDGEFILKRDMERIFRSMKRDFSGGDTNLFIQMARKYGFGWMVD